MSTLQTVNARQSDFIQIRLDSQTKKMATNILDKLGLSPSQAIKLFLNKVIMTRSIPFSLELSPDYIEPLSPTQSAEVGLALTQIQNGKYVKIDMSDSKAVKKHLGV
ncbi:MAG: type II toxin-antitoxin system RelB/DinJ family antitoxin [Microgenomates group bacterium]